MKVLEGLRAHLEQLTRWIDRLFCDDACGRDEKDLVARGRPPGPVQEPKATGLLDRL